MDFIETLTFCTSDLFVQSLPFRISDNLTNSGKFTLKREMPKRGFSDFIVLPQENKALIWSNHDEGTQCWPTMAQRWANMVYIIVIFW